MPLCTFIGLAALGNYRAHKLNGLAMLFSTQYLAYHCRVVPKMSYNTYLYLVCAHMY